MRPPQNTYRAIINWLLDQGVDGVLVPMVNSPEEARQALRAAKYPPLGRRSFGPFRAACYGLAFAEYAADANRRTALIVLIEDEKAARFIDEILAIEGGDAVFMRPNDLGYFMPKPGESLLGDPRYWSAFARTPEVIALCAHGLERYRAAGVPFGMTSACWEEAQEWLQRGASFVTLGNDFLFCGEVPRYCANLERQNEL